MSEESPEPQASDRNKVKKDGWDKADVIGRFAIPLTVGLGTLWLTHVWHKQAESFDQRLALLQGAIEREQSQSQIRAHMFQAMLDHMFASRLGIDERIAVLSLVLGNYVEQVDVGPLFALLEREIERSEGSGESGADQRRQLRALASEELQRQQRYVESRGGRVIWVPLEVPIDFLSKPLDLCGTDVAVSIAEREDNRVKVSLETESPLESRLAEVTLVTHFSVQARYYSFPFSDHIEVAPGCHVSVAFEGGRLAFTCANEAAFEPWRSDGPAHEEAVAAK